MNTKCASKRRPSGHGPSIVISVVKTPLPDVMDDVVRRENEDVRGGERETEGGPIMGLTTREQKRPSAFVWKAVQNVDGVVCKHAKTASKRWKVNLFFLVASAHSAIC